jgi:hypothetical protein
MGIGQWKFEPSIGHDAYQLFSIVFGLLATLTLLSIVFETDGFNLMLS